MKLKVSKALLEVWEMKQTVCDETRGLSGAAYFWYLRDEANRSFPGIRHGTPRHHSETQNVALGHVAEGRDKYGTR